MSKYVTKHVPLSTTKKSGHDSIVTPRLDDGGSNSSRHKTKKKRTNQLQKPSVCPFHHFQHRYPPPVVHWDGQKHTINGKAHKAQV